MLRMARYPSSGYRVPALHPDLQEGVDPALMKFRFINGQAAVRIALRTIHLCIENPRGYEAVTEWASTALPFVAPLVERWEARYGPLWASDGEI